MPAWEADAKVTWVHRLRLIPPLPSRTCTYTIPAPAHSLTPQSILSAVAGGPASTRVGSLSALLCPPPSRAPTSLGVKRSSRPSPPEAHKALRSLPRSLPLAPSSLCGLRPAPLTGGAWSCPRAFSHAAPSGTLSPHTADGRLASRALPSFLLSRTSSGPGRFVTRAATYVST